MSRRKTFTEGAPYRRSATTVDRRKTDRVAIKRIFGRHSFVVYGKEDGSVVFNVHDVFARYVDHELTPGDAEKLKVALATWLKDTKR